MSIKRHRSFPVIEDNGQAQWEYYRKHCAEYYYAGGIPPENIIELLPGSMKFSHYFWSWIWILSIPGCLALGFIKWWLIFAVLIVPSMIRKAVKQSIAEFVFLHAADDNYFFEVCINNEIIIKKTNR